MKNIRRNSSMNSKPHLNRKNNKEGNFMKLLEPIKVGNTTLRNRVMFPPLTTGYEERDGSIGEQSLAFYERLAEGGVAYIVLGDVVPIPTFSPTPKLFHDGQIASFKRLADAVHKYDTKVALQIFHPEYDAEAPARDLRAGACGPLLCAGAGPQGLPPGDPGARPCPGGPCAGH